MHSPGDIDAVVFDMGGVLVIPTPVRTGELVRAAGVALDFDAATAHRAHFDGIAAITALLGSGDVREHDPDVWSAYDHAYFAATGLDGDERAAAVAARRDFRAHGDGNEIWCHVLEANRDAMARIARNRAVAVVTNNNGTAIQQCLDMALCQVGPGPLTEVAAIVDSGVLGIAKPDPAIFAPALAALGTDPARTLYVGDTVHADVHGAHAAGMPVVQLDPYGHHDGHDHWRLPDVVALAEHLR
ncbi:MAG: HAD family hydrolase [Actinomycetota bacterium]